MVALRSASVGVALPSATSPSAASAVDWLFHEALFQDAEFHEALFQDAEFHDALFQDAEFHDALFQDAEFHDALFHDAEFQDAEFHDAEFHDAEFHEALAIAALFHDALLKLAPVVVPALPETTNASRPAFGFGGDEALTASEAWIVPTPPASPTPAASGAAVSMRAPLTWSGVQFGCTARMFAAAPLTIGAANEVPESCM